MHTKENHELLLYDLNNPSLSSVGSCQCICDYNQVGCHYDCHYILRYAESVGAVHYNASAKQNKGVQELFLDLSKSKCFVQSCCLLYIFLYNRNTGL